MLVLLEEFGADYFSGGKSPPRVDVCNVFPATAREGFRRGGVVKEQLFGEICCFTLFCDLFCSNCFFGFVDDMDSARFLFQFPDRITTLQELSVIAVTGNFRKTTQFFGL